jgi:hypothetical protein
MNMTDQSAVLPSDLALRELRERVTQDSTLLVAIKAAFLSDLDSQSPTTLTKLKSALKESDQSGETKNA